MRLLLLTPLLALACKDNGPTEPTEPTGEPTDSEFVPPPVQDCAAYDYRGQTYNCENTVDFCDNSPENLTARLACCECEPTYCLAPTDCPPPPPGTPTPPPPPPPPPTPVQQSSCMTCHNGAQVGAQLYSGPGITNPHYFGSAAYISCTSCHGGDGTPGNTKQLAHVASPPQFQNDSQLINDQVAYFNFLTKAGVDKFPDWQANGNTVTGLDWLQFMNPGDTRVIAQNRGCGQTGCHGAEHGAWVQKLPINTEVGFYSATMYTNGVDNALGITQYNNTAGDYAFRAVTDPDFTANGGYEDGRVPQLLEFPEYATFGAVGGDNFFQNQNILAANLNNQIHDGTFAGFEANRIVNGSDLQHAVMEAVALGCGDCHLGHMGANNRYADFRSSGCTACHMEYTSDGRSRSADPNVNRYEPANPDAIAAPERPHIDSHQIRNVAKFLPGGAFIRGVSDKACAGCHQGSNRTVLQYWGIRMDQNADVVNGFQYPANPQNFVTTQFDQRLYDPTIQNNTWNGRNFNQHLLEEDYDGDGLDDTPPDVHYVAGMGCIDCHGSFDMHAGTEGGPVMGIKSHQSQAMGITCESCHGDLDYAPATVACVDYEGNAAECPTDRFGNPLRNVTKVTQNGGEYFRMRSRLTGQLLWVPLTKDSVNAVSGKTHPVTNQLLYNPNASYSMGRIDVVPADADGTGPMQTNPQWGPVGFSHMDTMDCNACHASWENNCIGCHLSALYNADPANFFFSNTTGQRIAMNFDAQFTYQTPVLSQLIVGTQGKITQGQGGMKMFFKYQDIQGNFSDVFAFNDRNGLGNNPNLNGRNAFPALAHNKIAPHSTRGRTDGQNEGGKGCQSCHLTVAGLADDFNNDGFTNAQDYNEFITRYLDNNDFAAMNAAIDPNNANTDTLFQVLQQVIGQNTGNQLNHPIFVAMNAGLGTGLFLFDANGCPVNPLDANANRFFCQGNAPADNFDANNVVYDLDRLAERVTGVENISMSQPIQGGNVLNLRGGLKPNLAGPLSGALIERLADPNVGIILDSWLDNEGNAQGDAANYLYFVN
ncbi:MAG: hypothetical protein H6736_13975 [Alphaproteobacteria bacterium]|nr:hypothetical protein [Alphaproteobacteria bacterium]MCB9692915.1 hypothetical protein [Alphaproteobacteria bacterium]